MNTLDFPKVLQPWITIDMIDWTQLCSNPNPKAIELIKVLKQYIDTHSCCHEYYGAIKYCYDKLNWDALYSTINDLDFILSRHRSYIKPSSISANKNPNIIQFLKGNLAIDWKILSMNPNAIELLEANQDKIDWEYLSMNPNAISLLEANKDKIDWQRLTMNPNAIHLLEANQDKIDWDTLSMNPNATKLLEANPDKIDWQKVCAYTNSVKFIKNNLYICSTPRCKQELARNPNMIDLLKEHPYLIDWQYIGSNPKAYEFIQQSFNSRHEEQLSCRLDSSNPAIFIDDTKETRVKVNTNKSVHIIEELEKLQIQLAQERSINESFSKSITHQLYEEQVNNGMFYEEIRRQLSTEQNNNCMFYGDVIRQLKEYKDIIESLKVQMKEDRNIIKSLKMQLELSLVDNTQHPYNYEEMKQEKLMLHKEYKKIYKIFARSIKHTYTY